MLKFRVRCGSFVSSTIQSARFIIDGNFLAARPLHKSSDVFAPITKLHLTTLTASWLPQIDTRNRPKAGDIKITLDTKAQNEPARGVSKREKRGEENWGKFNNFMQLSVVNYRAMLTVVTTIVCLICYCCHRKIKLRSSTSSLYRQQRWVDTDPNMEIYSVEQVSFN